MSASAHPNLFSSPDHDRYFEDYISGAVHLLGEFKIVEDEMLAYAREFDPQEIHIDREKAAEGPFQGLIASGWYTGALMMRIFARNFLSNVSSRASPGIDGLRWLAPVRADDVLRVRVSILETRRSASKPDRGIVKSLIEVINQDDQLVMDIQGVNIIACDPARQGK
ncbi:MAG: MaoC family dehydratase [Rhodospirillales bacterium]|mgnify:CR=1 FL=1|jgi:acyl dehydratase|nr:MaoC family dehydratase [Rhodospirillales bacterium]MDP6642561.1 MaoC family dehydratase [Rhodospirillales bacterium]MDP6841892.1 MaoC family dehydratase [Rhodospirillales bacterium]|tara:strand:- start:606 stop:1106 length:501 start_codon:yes stop_codon:yes gene_type:complete